MSHEIINAPVQSANSDAVGASEADDLPASTPEYAPTAQAFVENVAEQGTGNREQETKEEKDARSPIRIPDTPPTVAHDAS